MEAYYFYPFPSIFLFDVSAFLLSSVSSPSAFVFCLSDSLISLTPFLNSLTPCPRPRIISGSFFPPKSKSARLPINRSSVVPINNNCVCILFIELLNRFHMSQSLFAIYRFRLIPSCIFPLSCSTNLEILYWFHLSHILLFHRTQHCQQKQSLPNLPSQNDACRVFVSRHVLRE